MATQICDCCRWGRQVSVASSTAVMKMWLRKSVAIQRFDHKKTQLNNLYIYSLLASYSQIYTKQNGPWIPTGS